APRNYLPGEHGAGLSDTARRSESADVLVSFPQTSSGSTASYVTRYPRALDRGTPHHVHSGLDYGLTEFAGPLKEDLAPRRNVANRGIRTMLCKLTFQVPGEDTLPHYYPHGTRRVSQTDGELS